MPTLAVVDTSVWVSAFLNPNGYPAQVYRSARDGTFGPVTSWPLLDELIAVLARPRIAKIRSRSIDEIRRFAVGILDVSTIVPITGSLALCRDPSDDIVLETAVVGMVTHVVSRDADLTRDLELAQQLKSHGIQPVTVSQFLKTLSGG